MKIPSIHLCFHFTIFEGGIVRELELTVCYSYRGHPGLKNVMQIRLQCGLVGCAAKPQLTGIDDGVVYLRVGVYH